jgi:hypothetical protein
LLQNTPLGKSKKIGSEWNILHLVYSYGVELLLENINTTKKKTNSNVSSPECSKKL